MHVGAEIAAQNTGLNVYWNAPTREDDIQGQIALLEKVVAGGYKGLVLAPDHALALITPVRLALSQGLPTVIVGSPLPIPAGGKLSYILNDDEEAGRMAGQYVAELLQNKGSVIVLGIDPDIAGIMIRARSLEKTLQDYPSIRIVDKRIGAFNTLMISRSPKRVFVNIPMSRPSSLSHRLRREGVRSQLVMRNTEFTWSGSMIWMT